VWKMETEWIRSRRGRAEATTTGTCRLPLATACRVHRIPNRLRASAPPAFAEKVRGRTGSAGDGKRPPATKWYASGGTGSSVGDADFSYLTRVPTCSIEL
jgi:hypothetical protein